jgi:CYTH domain-containing protein
MTQDVHSQDGRSESNEEVKESQIVSWLETGMEMTRQKRPNWIGREVSSCRRV